MNKRNNKHGDDDRANSAERGATRMRWQARGWGRRGSVRLRLLSLLGVMLLLVAMPLIATAADGDLDPTFGNGGIVTTDFGPIYAAAYAVAIQDDGKTVAAGHCGDGGFHFCLARYNSNGSLDTSFDGDGKLATTFGTSQARAQAVSIQRDGRVVATGYCATPLTANFCLARYNSDGSLDTSFGSGGMLVTPPIISSDVARAATVQSDGKIVAAGRMLHRFVHRLLPGTL